MLKNSSRFSWAQLLRLHAWASSPEARRSFDVVSCATAGASKVKVSVVVWEMLTSLSSQTCTSQLLAKKKPTTDSFSETKQKKKFQHWVAASHASNSLLPSSGARGHWFALKVHVLHSKQFPRSWRDSRGQETSESHKACFFFFFVMSCSGHRVDISSTKLGCCSHLLLWSSRMVNSFASRCQTIQKKKERESRDWINLNAFSGDRICF